MQPERKHSLPDIASLLTSGGDARIIIGQHGMSKYGCFPTPQPDILSYSSCTASTISEAGFAAVRTLYRRLGPDIDAVTYADELNRIRQELTRLCDLSLPGLDIIFSASGTDAHHLVAERLSKDAPLFVIMPGAAETGSGVPAALSGNAIETFALKSRLDNGDLRDADQVNAEAKASVTGAIAAGKRVLLVMTDISKTGLIIPSPACALALKQRFPDKIDVLIDACQWRLAGATLHAYLKQDFTVAVTGSKFMTGPAFSAALFVPKSMAKRLRASAEAVNYGLLLRWEAALVELRAFHALPEKNVQIFIERFAAAMQKRFDDDASFESFPTRPIDRKPLTDKKSWDQSPTIFPFRLRHRQSGALLDKNQATVIYERLQAARIYVGQPVNCGALRLCLDTRLIVRGNDTVINDAMRVLDEVAMLLSRN